MVVKNSATRFRSQCSETASASMSAASPASSGWASMDSLLCLLALAAKQVIEDDSETVSAKVTTGSDTLTSTPENISRRSWSMQSSPSSPVPTRTCSPLSSTLLLASGYVLVTLRMPSRTFGSSLGFSGSTETVTTALVVCFRGAKMATRDASSPVPVMVAVLAMTSSTPPMRTRHPGGALVISVRYRACPIEMPVTDRMATSSSSSAL